MSDINELLLQMLQARYGKDVRQSIHDSIEMCYDEATGKIQKELIESITTNANRAESAASDAETSAETATEKAAEAAGYATGETESALYYYNQVKNISQSLSGALKPVGTVTFEALPELSEVEAGDMYNISNQFTTTESFKEGAGKVVPAGSNVYKTSDYMWDVLAGSPVAGVKGEEEAVYRQGLINITADNIGALKKNGNAKDVTVAFTSGDSVTAPDNTLPELLVTNETLSSLLSKVSTGIKNIRWLIKTIGTKDISGIGDGSITGAISTLDSNMWLQLTTQPESNYTSILAIVKAVPNDKNRVYSIKSTFTDYPPIMTAMGYTVYPVIKITSKGSVRYIELIACDASGRTKIIKGYTTIESSTIVWQEEDNICNALHLQATNSADSLSVFTAKVPDKYKNVSSLMYAISQIIGNWGTWSVCNTDVSNGVIRIATNYTGSDVFSPWFSILLFY